MKMVRSVLLGSAAGLVAVTAGQAADLPVKAQAVQYVKVCSMYGAGFYYMPGTDMCIKIGGWVRAEMGWGANGSYTWGSYQGNVNNRATNSLLARARGYITADAREQTAYGVARGYIAVGLSTNDVGLNTPANIFSANRAFIQFAGFTAGIAQSFYDFYSSPAMAYYGFIPSSDTGDPGWWVWGYTAQLGGGFTATISAEQRRTMQIVDANCASAAGTLCGAVTPGAFGVVSSTSGGIASNSGAYGGWQAPDIVANLRVDQAWGGAQIMGAAHEVNANYYANAAGPPPPTTLTPALGHPSDQWGWAAGAGLKLNFPMIAPGDWFQTQFNYTVGAARYAFFSQNSNWGKVDGGSEAFGVLSDCVYGGSLAAGTATGCQLTTAWGVNAGYEHYWTPQWHQSIVGGYSEVKYNSTANAMLCADETAAPSLATGSTTAATPGCNNNWSTWGVSTRLQYDITKSFYIGVEGLYQNLRSATIATAPPVPTSLAAGAVTTQESNSSNWAVRVRMHKDFLP
jgi:hypothetical protein